MRILLTTSLYLLFCLAVQAQEKHSLLWRISGQGMEKPSYLFGTIHVHDQAVFQFADSVMLALESVDAFAMELHPDTVIRGLFTESFSNQDGENELKEILSEEEYEQFEERFKESTGMDLDDVNQKNPMLLASMMSSRSKRKGNKKTFMDGHLYGVARTLKKPVYGLEELQDQLRLFTQMKDDEVYEMLMAQVDSNRQSQHEKMRDSIIEMYSNGNLDNIEKVANDAYGKDSTMISRNRVMSGKIDSLIKHKSLFAAVGMAHLPGENGMIEMLREKGYRVESVQSPFTGIADRYVVDHNKMNWSVNHNEEFGFKIDAPGQLFRIEAVNKIPTYIYPDVGTGMFFMINVMDMRGMGNINEDKFIENLLNNKQGQMKGEVIRKKRVKMNGFDAVEIVLRSSRKNYLKNRFVIRNNVLYILTVGPDKNQLDEPFVDRYFESFESFKSAEQLNSDWELHSERKAAYSVLLPNEPQTKVTMAENPIDPASDDYVIYINYSVDLAHGANYLVRYNDNPPGYFIPEADMMLEEMITEFATTGTDISEPDTITLDGYPGRAFSLKLLDKYHTDVRVYIRGNRTYALLAQNLKENATNLTKPEFFESFTFETYAKPRFVETLEVEGEPFEVQLFSKEFVQEMEGESMFTSLTNISCTNPMSGGLYQLEYGDLHDYFRILDLDTFYHQIAENSGEYGDSVLRIDQVTMGGAPGVDILWVNEFTDKQSRYRFWIDGKKYFAIFSDVSKDEILTEAHNLFYEEAYIKTDSFLPFDHFASKIDPLFAGLLSTDSLEHAKSLEALEFYEFSEDEVDRVFDLAGQPMDDDTLSYGTRSYLISHLVDLDHENTLPFLAELYRKEETTEALKGVIMDALGVSENPDAFKTFYDLLINGPYLSNPQWGLMQPLKDSVPFTLEHWQEIVALVDHKDYRKKVLDLAEVLLSEDSSSTVVIHQHSEKLFSHLEEDLQEYEEKGSKEFYYMEEHNNYLLILQHLTDLPFTDSYTTRFIESSKSNFWMVGLAVEARIYNRLTLPKKITKNLFKSDESRFEMMIAHWRSNQVDQIPEKYRNYASFGQSCVYNNFAYYNDYPDKIELMGSFEYQDSLFYAYRTYFKNDPYDLGYYLGVAGPFAPGEMQLDYKRYNYPAETDLEAFQEDWKSQAIGIIETFRMMKPEGESESEFESEE